MSNTDQTTKSSQYISHSTATQSSKLTKEQKETISILSIGTFLELFDFFLYAHMSTILDKVFFPEGYNGFLSTFLVTATFMFRPLGALFFGWIGDNIGRKSVVFFTTIGTSLICGMTAILPEYTKCGMLSAYILTAFRISQGLMSMGEIQSARLYLSEMLNSKYNKVLGLGMIEIAAQLGGLFAIFASTAACFLRNNDIVIEGWRIIFTLGAIIACIGTYARSTFKESSEFTDAKNLIKKGVILDDKHPVMDEKVNKLSCFYYTIMIAGSMSGLFFLPIIYCKKFFVNMSSWDILVNNICVMMYLVILDLLLVLYVFYLRKNDCFNNLFRLVICRILGALIVGILLPFLLKNYSIKIIQILFVTFLDPVFLLFPCVVVTFPVFKRSMCIFICFALASTITSIFFTFSYHIESIIPVNYIASLWMIPISAISLIGIKYFIKVNNNA